MHALASTTPVHLSVTLVGRDQSRLAALADSASRCAAAGGGKVSPSTIAINWADEGQICQVLAALEPKVVVHTASLQSPWTLGGADGWSSLVNECGFGITLPLHTVLALKLGNCIRNSSPASHYINACYPDSVNALLLARGIKVTCGIGNVAILAVLFSEELRFDPRMRMRIIAHHAHLAALTNGRLIDDESMQVWMGDSPLRADALARVKRMRLVNGPWLNAIAGLEAAPLILSLAGCGPPWTGHSSGPLGLPGGYPITANSCGITLDLPAGFSLSEAIRLNREAASLDGVSVGVDGTVTLSKRAISAIERNRLWGGTNSDSWAAAEVETEAEQMLRLRDLLGMSQG